MSSIKIYRDLSWYPSTKYCKNMLAGLVKGTPDYNMVWKGLRDSAGRQAAVRLRQG